MLSVVVVNVECFCFLCFENFEFFADPESLQAAYEHTPLIATVPYTTDSTSLDYVPQFLTSGIPSSSSFLPNRTWWMNFPPTPTPSLLSSPSTPSVVHSPSSSNTAAASPLSVNSPTTVSLLTHTDTLQGCTPSKSSLKTFPGAADPLKLQPERWNITEPSSVSPRSADKIETLAGSPIERGIWKVSDKLCAFHMTLLPRKLVMKLSKFISFEKYYYCLNVLIVPFFWNFGY